MRATVTLSCPPASSAVRTRPRAVPSRPASAAPLPFPFAFMFVFVSGFVLASRSGFASGYGFVSGFGFSCRDGSMAAYVAASSAAGSGRWFQRPSLQITTRPGPRGRNVTACGAKASASAPSQPVSRCARGSARAASAVIVRRAIIWSAHESSRVSSAEPVPPEPLIQ